MDRVSSAGYALGYVGGGLLLALNLAWILKPSLFGLPDAGVASRLSFLSVAVWWVLFSIPLFRRVPEPTLRPRDLQGRSPIAAAFHQLGSTLRDLRRYRQAFLMLVAFLIYNDGIGTMIRMAGPYGQEIGLPQNALITAFVMVQFVGIPFAFAFGWLAGRIGAKTSIFIALLVYVVISIVGYYMTSAWQFFLLSFLVATVQGGSQALSRSLFASMIPPQQIFRVLRVLRRLREVRRDRGAGAVCHYRSCDRIEPQRDPLGDRILRHRRAAAVESRRRRRQAGRC